MQPLGTKVYLLKYSPSDSFCTFFSESVFAQNRDLCLKQTIKKKEIMILSLSRIM